MISRVNEAISQVTEVISRVTEVILRVIKVILRVKEEEEGEEEEGEEEEKKKKKKDKQNFSLFYRTLSPTGAAAQFQKKKKNLTKVKTSWQKISQSYKCNRATEMLTI